MSSISLRQAVVQVGEQHRVGELNAEIPAGEIVAIVGPNGAGKTTTLKALSGLVPLASGQRMIHGADDRNQKKACAYAPAHLLSDLPFTVEDVAQTGLYDPKAATRLSEDQVKRMEEMLSAFALQNLRQRRIGSLSTGELQRVNLARTFVQNRPYLMLDEPFGPLDISYYKVLIELIRHEATRNNRGIAIVLHDLNLALQVSSQTILVHSSKTVCQGPSRDVITPERVKMAFGVDADTFTIKGDIAQLAYKWT